MNDEHSTSSLPTDPAAPETQTVTPAQQDGRAQTHELSGQLISGRYRVEECLGRGAMGEVYRATHILMEKAVAIKVLRPQLDQRDELVERFRREAQAAAHIDHPNVCQATDFGQMEDGTFFLVIEYLQGQTLEDRLRLDGSMSAQIAVDIALQIASALERAHELDVVHRDLKPENIMLVEREGGGDIVKILDFGVARVRLTDRHEDAQLTQAGTVWGTPTYMSPEQATGGEVDGRADLYSLGVILYEMLCGRPPFDDSNAARVMALHVTLKPPSFEEVRPGLKVPAALEALVFELLEKDPEARPSSARELRRRLQELAEQLERGLQPWPDVQTGTKTDASPAHKATLPEQFIARLMPALTWFRAKSLWSQGAILGLVAALFLVMAAASLLILVSSNAPPDAQITVLREKKQEKKVERNLEAERAEFLEKNDLTDVPVALDEERISDALEALEGVDEAQQESPHFWYLRARTNAARGRWQASMNDYERVLSQEKLYTDDETLIDDIMAGFAQKNASHAKPAGELIDARLDTPAVNQKLADQAKFGRLAAIRKRAFDMLKDTGRLDTLEAWNRLSVEMNHSQGCAARKKIIADLVDQGDPRGVEILEKFAKKPTRGCGFLNLEDCYGCLRTDLRKAINALKDSEK